MSDNEPSKNHRNSVFDQFVSGFSSGIKSPISDINALKNRGTNTAEHSKNFSRKKKDSGKESDLEKKDKLEDKKDDKDSKKSDKKDKKDDKSEKSDKKNSSIKDNIENLNPAVKVAKKWKELKIKLIIIGVLVAIFATIFIIAALYTIFDDYFSVIGSYFGIPEVDKKQPNTDEVIDGYLTSDKYYTDPDTGEAMDSEKFIEQMKEDNDCSNMSFWNKMVTIIDGWDGNYNSVCSFVRYIEMKESDLENDYPGLQMDRALPIASIFFGYASQPNYSYYDNPEDVEIISPINHFDTLSDIINNGKLKKSDLDTMIDYSVSKIEYTYYEWEVEDEKTKKDETPTKRIGYCKSRPTSDIHYSLLKWQILMRFGAPVADAYDSYTSMARAYSATDDECKGLVDEATLLQKVAGGTGKSASLDGSVNAAINEMKNKNITGLEAFEQKATITGKNKDYFTNFQDIEFDYKNGFIYEKFPIYKQSFENPDINIEYDDAITPKKIENVIQYVYEKKPDINEILDFPEQDNPTGYLDGANSDSSVVTGAHCGQFLSAPLNSITVTVKDCNGKVLLTTSFRDYIMGVAYGEVSNTNDDYVLSEMVAAISYALKRRDNYKAGSNIVMRTGNCDQVYCSMKQGCHPETSNISCGSFNCTSYPPGGNGSHGPASADLINKYSALYDRASDFLLVSNGTVFSAHYVSSIQNEWYAKASSGMSFTQIMQETYASEGAELIRCSAIDEKEEEGDSTPDSKRVGNRKTSEYPEVAPDMGIYYGFSYNKPSTDRNININPAWTTGNLTTVNTNCPAANWNVDYTVNTKAKSKFERAFASMCTMLTTGVKIKGDTCKYSVSDFTNGDTFYPRLTSSGGFSLHAYGLAQDWNYSKKYTVNGVEYDPYGANRDLSQYNAFYSALGGEEKCGNVNYILYKYAYEPAGFNWGGNWGRNGNSATFDGMHFEVRY